MLAMPSDEPMEKSAGQFIQAVETRLSLTLTDWGEPLELQ
jgi:hypothetical protein